ncbi:exosortase family protein XrtF [Flavitalea sp. BT771]|uniref:exosortase family protein XrtF n=1 Tax=Flavitalea sp. BT771 TaxID=3063329 RepID=UPI0026E3A40D|nr:exosortase family protein XrtF [Flavitalea sp. BT771]MDO6435069.1 exosortase family protein XrtF [Flavitalea sp. BT771]MDV6223969.1 exosortase family protein XrtF [Flavitalea sp. BT771]
MDTLYSGGGLQIPRPVVKFFVKAFLLFVVWKALYIFLLLPGRVLDRPLTRFVGNATVGVMNVVEGHAAYSALEARESLDIRRDGEQTLRVADACNALELMVLYIGFILCFPAPGRRKVIFILAGCVLITLFNVLRCMALVWIFVHYRAYLDFSHHFLFTFLIYAFIFLLWYIFTKKLTFHGRTA